MKQRKTKSIEIETKCASKAKLGRFSLQTDRQTDRQTDKIYTPSELGTSVPPAHQNTCI